MQEWIRTYVKNLKQVGAIPVTMGAIAEEDFCQLIYAACLQHSPSIDSLTGVTDEYIQVKIDYYQMHRALDHIAPTPETGPWKASELANSAISYVNRLNLASGQLVSCLQVLINNETIVNEEVKLAVEKVKRALIQVESERKQFYGVTNGL
jgi:hypothetical protein